MAALGRAEAGDAATDLRDWRNVRAQFGLDPRRATRYVRLGPGIVNAPGDVDAAVRAIASL